MLCVLQSSVQVEIIVQDVNDNAPQFEVERYSARIQEHPEPNTPLTLVRKTAIHFDSRTVLTFALRC